MDEVTIDLPPEVAEWLNDIIEAAGGLRIDRGALIVSMLRDMMEDDEEAHDEHPMEMLQ